jgi:hypothetical protein
MAKIATLTEAKNINVGDVIASTSPNGPLHRAVTLIRHTPGSDRYAFNLDDNDYFTLDEGDSAYVITEE